MKWKVKRKILNNPEEDRGHPRKEWSGQGDAAGNGEVLWGSSKQTILTEAEDFCISLVLA